METRRPQFYICQHDSSRWEPLSSLQYGNLVNTTGFGFTTTPITNRHFYESVVELVRPYVGRASDDGSSLVPDPIVPPLTTRDTALFPNSSAVGMVAYSSAWIDLASPHAVVASVSRQVLNLEVAYANFCGIPFFVVPGPRQDAVTAGGGRGVAQFGRAVQEAMLIGTRLQFIIHLPMYREPGLEEKIDTLSAMFNPPNGTEGRKTEYIDLFSAWDTWHRIRTVCNYSPRVAVALRFPRVMPEKDLQERWFCEPLMYLTFGPQTFQTNKAGHPALSKAHQEMINAVMRLKAAPSLLLYDVGPDVATLDSTLPVPDVTSASEFPSLDEASKQPAGPSSPQPAAHNRINAHVQYLKYLERQQEPYSALEHSTLHSFQDWLQSPLQPLSDNLESSTYEMFEGDPVKYDQYEVAMIEALSDWAALAKPTSSLLSPQPDRPGAPGPVVVAVAGSGRGPLVTRALRASDRTGVPVEVWAVEKNPNAFVFLLRQNETVWGGRVNVVKTDMRAWKGPAKVHPDTGATVHGKVDILVSELLGSFGDNELSPECLDGIQHVLAPEHGISIPASYTAHLTPVATPRLHAEIAGRAAASDATAFDTPWVVRLFAVDYLAARAVPGRARFQRAWEFAHPLPDAVLAAARAKRDGGVVGGGGGSMSGGVGANDHNARHCHLTFVCRARGVCHGLAGYFESTLYASSSQAGKVKAEGGAAAEESEDRAKAPVELSILPEMIDRKSKDMISWFPIFFPLKQPLYFPDDTELEASMWRQTDDTKVWYEWMVEAFMWVSPTQRIAIGASDICSSRKVACIM